MNASGWALCLAMVGCTPGSMLPADPSDAQPPQPPPTLVSLHNLHARRARAGRKLPGPMLEAELSFTLPRDAAGLTIRSRCESGDGLIGSEDLLATRGLRRGQHARLFAPLFSALPLAAMPQRCELQVFITPRPGTGEAPGPAGVFCAHKGIVPGACPGLASVDHGAPAREVIRDGESLVVTLSVARAPARRLRITAKTWPHTLQTGAGEWCLGQTGKLRSGRCPSAD